MQGLKLLNHFILTSLALLGLSVTSANAALVNYDESVSGDLSQDGASPTFTLDMVGANTWQGTTSWNAPVSLDHDRFQISIDPSLQVINYSVTWSNLISNPASSSTTFRANLGDTPTTALQFNRVDVVSGLISQPGPPASLPITLPSLFLNIGPAFCSGDMCDVGAQVDYLILIETAFVNPVPLPAAVWLFGSALIGLVGFSKRRKTA